MPPRQKKILAPPNVVTLYECIQRCNLNSTSLVVLRLHAGGGGVRCLFFCRTCFESLLPFLPLLSLISFFSSYFPFFFFSPFPCFLPSFPPFTASLFSFPPPLPFLASLSSSIPLLSCLFHFTEGLEVDMFMLPMYGSGFTACLHDAALVI